MKRLPLDHVSAGGENIITTPPTCHSGKRSSKNGGTEYTLCKGLPLCGIWQNQKIHVVKNLVLTNGKMCGNIYTSDMASGFPSAQ